jgi:hypothetical protein
MSRRLGGGAGVGIGLVASALGALGAPLIIWVLILLLGIVLVVHAFTTSTSDSTGAGKERGGAERGAIHPSRRSTLIPESAFELQRPFRDYGEAEAERRVSLYIGCRARAAGYVSEPAFIGFDIGQDVALSRRPNTAPVVYSFFSTNKPNLNWRAGKRISVEGTVQEISAHAVVLTDCVAL